ncbi:MAG: short-chain dehydrogenase/reductase [Subtercola sp.]|jgi:NAD(P)-dependent dehydrogenase (short-subunit alcohol dehydrogenase family)|nr:short-chain dehydrogenase/reductase [Subtercola sp.]
MSGVSVVTGGGGGIGREVALRLAARGDAVSVWDRDPDAARTTADAIVEAGGRAESEALDVADQDQVRDATARAISAFGNISTLMTGAGYSRFVDFLDLTIEEWTSMLTVHATGTFVCAQAVTPSMIDAHFGRMVFISSLAGLSGSAGHVHYAAAKAAILGLTKALCKELGPSGITVNAIAPGAIDTPMLKLIKPEIAERNSNNPVGRVGTPADVAETVLFLASPQASFITGAVVNLSGGAYTY